MHLKMDSKINSVIGGIFGYFDLTGGVELTGNRALVF